MFPGSIYKPSIFGLPYLLPGILSQTNQTLRKTYPSWEFPLSASRISLQSYELSRLNHAANLRKEIGTLLDQWIEENTAAMLARLLMEHRERLPIMQEPVSTGAPPKDGAHASDTFLRIGPYLRS